MYKAATIWLAKGADWFELSHTPGYLESISLWQKIWGAASPDHANSIAILRSFGVFTSILTSLVFLLGLRLNGLIRDRLSTLPVLTLAILMLHPYLIQYSLLIDYDNTMMALPLLLAVILIEYWDRSDYPHWTLALTIGLVLAVALFAKELTPLIFLVLWPFWAFLRRWRSASRSWVMHLIQALVGCTLAIGLIFVFLRAWGELRGFHWYDPLHLSREKFFGRKESGGLLPWNTWGWARFLFLSYLPVLWIGLPTLFVFFKTKARLTSMNLARIPFSIWASAAIFGAYTILVQAAFYFPKYTAPAWPILLYGLAQNIDVRHLTVKKNRWLPIGALLAVLFALGFIQLFDPLLIIENRTTFSFAAASQHFMALSLPVAALWLLSLASCQKHSILMFVGLLFYFVGTDVGHILRPYSTRFLYGEHGFKETIVAVERLKARISPNEPVLNTARDIHWMMGLNSSYLEMTGFRPNTVKWTSKILVSRSYGESSIARNLAAFQEVQASYACHQTVDSPGHRFEWWWKPPHGEQCDGTLIHKTN